MKTKRFVLPEYVTAEDIKSVRKKLGLTQKNFAELIGCSKSTVERWESGSETVSGPIVLLLRYLEREPESIQRLEVPEQVYPLRLWYMHNQTVCTLIDVDELN